MRAGENIPNLCWEISVWTEEPERMVLSLDLGDCDTEEAEVEDGGRDMRLRITLRTLSFVLTALKLLAP